MDTQTDRQTDKITRGLASVGLRPDYLYLFDSIYGSKIKTMQIELTDWAPAVSESVWWTVSPQSACQDQITFLYI